MHNFNFWKQNYKFNFHEFKKLKLFKLVKIVTNFAFLIGKRSKFRTLDPGSVWHYFFPDPKKECSAICRTCGKSISYFYQGNDKGTLPRHLKRMHKEYYNQMNRIQSEWFSHNNLKRKLIYKI